MKRILLLMGGLCLWVASAQGQCTGLGCAVESNSKAIEHLQRDVRALDPMTRAEADSLLAVFRSELALQLAGFEASASPTAQPDGWNWPLILGIAGTVLGASALIYGLAHHHHVDVEQNLEGDGYVRVTITRPGWCFPPGHCRER